MFSVVVISGFIHKALIFMYNFELMKLLDLLLNKDHFYIMHLSYDGRNRRALWDYAKTHDIIGLDLPNLVIEDWNNIKDKVRDSMSNTWINQFNMLCNEMDKNDIVVVLCGWKYLLGVAEIKTHRYKYNQDLSGENGIFFDHIREVNWIKKNEYNHRVLLPTPLRGFNNTLSRVNKNTRRWITLKKIII